MAPFARVFLRKVGRPRLVILLTVLTFLLSLIIKYFFDTFFISSSLIGELAFIFTASCIIAPLMSWYLLGLLFELDELEIKLTKLATIDSLTNTYNRGYFYAQSEAYLAQLTNQQASIDTAVAIIDLDDFKSINDVLGHAVGDKALHELSSLLREFAPSPNIVGRLGGDEFVCLLVETNLSDLTKLLKSLVLAVRDISIEGNITDLSITVSIGVAFIEIGDEFDDALLRADEALYRVKKQGKNGYMIYDASF
ncbi:GGDEF domain-containing protein [Marinomonas sp. C2222]|uniref:diguanylate cyclase n=1 Tax=Marinomonas sargassi TaxID=2984494 RepID=A0ABT2YUJ4_9GAMM|nr:GGDEF domain-containing protein [Marinomonas sargassi]MCV2403566.1 GGDEF domain-containing protein [Marinomonas sargassi]